MSYEQRKLTEEMMPWDDDGRTFLTAWLASHSAPAEVESEEETTRTDWLVIDGISLHPITLCAVGEDFTQLAPTKMSVRELRAELSARQGPVRGNKKELVKQIQVR